MAWLSGGAKSMTNPVKAFGLPTLLSDFTERTPNKGMQRTRNQHVSHARLVCCGGSCAPLMPSVTRRRRWSIPR